MGIVKNFERIDLDRKNIVSVVIPCFNEELAVFPVLTRLNEAFLSWGLLEPNLNFEMILVDDGSSDETLKKLKAFDTPFTKRVYAIENRGYGGALKFGFKKARGEWISFLDMDDTYDPCELPALYQKMIKNSWKMVVGDRLSLIDSMPWTRQIGNQLFVNVINQLFQKKVNDCCSGMRIFHWKLVEIFDELLPENLNFTLAMTFLFLRFSVPFGEIPIRYAERIGQSKLSIMLDGPRFLLTIFKYWIRYKFQSKSVVYAERSFESI